LEKWLEIDLGNLKENIKALKGFFQVPVMAVIKQNAYGLGAVTIGRFMEKNGITFFAVTTVSEGVELRLGGVTSPVLIFAPFYDDPEELKNLWQYNLIPAVYSLAAAEKLNAWAVKTAGSIDVHLKADTGMGRMGFTSDELLVAAQRLRELTGLKYTGIYTHFSNAFEKEINYTRVQTNRLKELVQRLAEQGIDISLKYGANSLAALKFPETHMDMVNIGSAVPLKKAYRCQAKVLQIRTLTKGSYVGYSNTYKVETDTRVAVIPIGYTDGFGVQKKIDSFRFNDFLRELVHLMKIFTSQGNSIFYNGKPLRVLGKTSLQLTVVEVGDIPIKPGDIVDIDINPLFANARLERIYTGDASVPELGFAREARPLSVVKQAEAEAAAAAEEKSE
jgi:alanine racemase